MKCKECGADIIHSRLHGMQCVANPRHIGIVSELMSEEALKQARDVEREFREREASRDRMHGYPEKKYD